MYDTQFEHGKIFENLQYVKQPKDYQGKIPWTVQQQIAATNGVHYKRVIGHLKEYPIPSIPLPGADGNQLMLDIGNGWGRWLVAAGKKHYIPVGIDLRLEFCQTSRKVLQDHGLQGYTVVADLKRLPFLSNIFDVVWSFGVIQHTHLMRFIGCLEDIQRILKPGSGFCYLEFPNKNGLFNHFVRVSKYEKTRNEYNSWDVRYYSIKEYKDIFMNYFDNFQYFNHSALGIGVLPGDLKFATGVKNKLGILVSRSLSRIFEWLTPLKAISDSVYISCKKSCGTAGMDWWGIGNFMRAHQQLPSCNLNIVHLLACPVTHSKLVLSEDRTELISPAAHLAYPISDDIPIMVPSEARTL
jgi:uncharacterized protein YbaR (Trm112 family)/ubiquinone/menaquinone biosynthesis C-methylase UbiE